MCDSCEEEVVEFFCKMCFGYFCLNCKVEYEWKKIIWNYEIVLLMLKNDDMIEFFYCIDYNNKKLECYCNFCNKFVCIECIVNVYNGYFVKLFFIVLNEIRVKIRF